MESKETLFYFKVLTTLGIGGYFLYIAYKRTRLVHQQIQDERNSITREGERLGSLKSQAITSNTPLPDDYAIQLLKLIKKIVTHDMTYRNSYGQEQAVRRRGNLSNYGKTF